MNTPLPGWYPDPWMPDLLRWWDGVRWTEHRLAPVPPPEPAPTLPWQVAAGAIASMAVPLVVSRWILHGLADLDWPIGVYMVLAALLAYLPPMLFWRYASRRWGSGDAGRDVGLAIQPADAGWGPLTWISSFTVQALLAVLVTRFGIPFQSNTDSVRELRDDRGYVIAILVVSVLVAPVVEEIVFRGLILRGLRSRMPVWLAVAVQGVLFGAAHFSPERGVRNAGLVLVLSGAGIVLGTAAALTKRLAPGMIAHAIINTIAMVVVLSGYSAEDAHVVDQAHVAEPHGGDGHGVLVDPLHPAQRAVVDELEVLEPCQRFALHDLAPHGHETGGAAFACGGRALYRTQ